MQLLKLKLVRCEEKASRERTEYLQQKQLYLEQVNSNQNENIRFKTKLKDAEKLIMEFQAKLKLKEEEVKEINQKLLTNIEYCEKFECKAKEKSAEIMKIKLQVSEQNDVVNQKNEIIRQLKTDIFKLDEMLESITSKESKAAEAESAASVKKNSESLLQNNNKKLLSGMRPYMPLIDCYVDCV